MTAYETLCAVVPHLPYYGLRLEDGRDGGVSAGGFPAIPPVDVLNMSYEVRVVAPNEAIDRPGLLILPDRGVVCPPTVDLVVAWNADEAAHIEAVTGEPLLSDGGFVAWDGGKLPVGVVAARFHVTGCHLNNPVGDTPFGNDPCCSSPWARFNDDRNQPNIWHWTGTAERIDP